MRRLLLASCISLLPGLALAQSAANPSPGVDQSASGPSFGPGMMGGNWGPGTGMMGNSLGTTDGGWGMMSGDWGKDHRGFGPDNILIDFYAANTTHDGHLTLAQAKTADFKPAVDHFAEIDVKHRGYVTFYDIVAWRMDDMAKHLEEQADALRAKD